MVAGAALATPERPSVRPDRDALATVTLEAAHLDFEVTAAYERAVVTVNGRGLERTTQRFNAGESLSMALVDKEGSPLADGMYRYTLRIQPRPEKGSGIETGLFYIEGGVAVSRESKREELAGVRAELNQDRETWMAERMAKMKNGMRELPERPERPLGPPASKEDFLARQEAMKQERGEQGSGPGRSGGGSFGAPGSEIGGGISRPPGPEPFVNTYGGVYVYGAAPYLFFYEYGYGSDFMQMNGGILRHYGYSTRDYHFTNYRFTYYDFDYAYRSGRGSYQGNFDWAYGSYGQNLQTAYGIYGSNAQRALGYYGANIRGAYGGYYSGNYDFGSRNVRAAYYGNLDYGYYGNAQFATGYNGTNYAYAGYRNYRRAFINRDYATYNWTLAAYGNYQGAFYGNNVLRAYGQFYNGYPIGPYQQPFNFIYSYAYDYGTYTPLYNFMAVGPVGVGVNTLYPTADFEVYDYKDFSAVRLNNYYSVWAFSATPTGDFTVNKIGSGGQEFTVSERLDASGPTMYVQGSVRGTQFIATSSRDAKTDFRTLDGKEVLDSLAELPVMSWRFKTEDESIQHFGPVAEDFQAAFQVGDGKSISSVDVDGVALAAIQGLHSLLEEKSAALEELRTEKDQEIADLTRRLAALEERLQTHPADGH
jgi:hypothetical protein